MGRFCQLGPPAIIDWGKPISKFCQVRPPRELIEGEPKNLNGGQAVSTRAPHENWGKPKNTNSGQVLSTRAHIRIQLLERQASIPKKKDQRKNLQNNRAGRNSEHVPEMRGRSKMPGQRRTDQLTRTDRMDARKPAHARQTKGAARNNCSSKPPVILCPAPYAFSAPSQDFQF